MSSRWRRRGDGSVGGESRFRGRAETSDTNTIHRTMRTLEILKGLLQVGVVGIKDHYVFRECAAKGSRFFRLVVELRVSFDIF